MRSAKDRISPRVPSFIKAFARHLIYRNGGQSNLLSIRIPLLSLELIEVILWVVLVALYHKWIPNLPGSGVFLIHQGQEPEPVPFSGFHTITIPMLALVRTLFKPLIHNLSSDKLSNLGHCLLHLDLLYRFSAFDCVLSTSHRVLHRSRTPLLDSPPRLRHCIMLVERCAQPAILWGFQ